MDVPIVISAFNRPDALSRILGSLRRAQYDRHDITLYISIDGGGDPACSAIAEEFDWKHGPKIIIIHPDNLGLKRHILSCSSLALRHDGVIVLEDDLFVAPDFYPFVQAALSFYKNDPKIAGVSLYAHNFNESAQLRFYPLQDGSDTFFMQLASSWGQCYTREHWSSFFSWYSTCSVENPGIEDGLPPDVAKWPSTSWKKHFIHYLIANDLYFVFPYSSRSTNFGDAGVNHKNHTHFQVPLNIGSPSLRFHSFEDSAIKYDSYCEILPEALNRFTEDLKDYDYMVDLYGMKQPGLGGHKYALTVRVSENPIKSFGRSMVPHEANVIYGIGSDEIVLSHVEHLQTHTLDSPNKRMVYYYRMPRWYLKEKLQHDQQIAFRLKEDEDILLRIYSRKIGKIIFKPILMLHQIYIRIVFFFK